MVNISAVITTISDGSKRRKRDTTAMNVLDTIGPIGPTLPTGCNYGNFYLWSALPTIGMKDFFRGFNWGLFLF